jgi:mono/diheme cytochrome c family protein
MIVARHIAGLSICLMVMPWMSLYAQQDDTPSPPVNLFARDAVPFMRTHCIPCHGKNEPEGGLSFADYRTSANVQTDYETWEKVIQVLVERKMPPEDKPRPPEPQLRATVAAIKAELAKFDCGGQRHPGRVTIRRLNREEYNNTVRDLLGVDFRPADDFPSDDVGNGFDNIGDVLSMPPLLVEKYLAAAESVIEAAYANEKTRRRFLVHRAGDNMSGREAARRNLTEFATRAFRRPVTDDELRRLFRLMQSVRELGATNDESYRTALYTILSSPHFLFRVELDHAAVDDDGIRKLNDFELASRLSYFLWSSMPDRELFQLAREKLLQQPDVLRRQVQRMLKDEKAHALTSNFAGQWLQLRSLAEITPDSQAFPSFDEELRTAMRQETEMFFEAIVREDRSILDFLTAEFTFVNQRLARHYGIPGVEGTEFQRVQLPSRRRGVLTQASILLLTSNPTRTSPVKRGKWILDNILGEPPPPPPEGVEELDPDAVTLGTLRERMEQHRSNESCAVCHRKMDALGFGLENFDVIGAWRDRDGRFEIDASGSLPGGRDFRDASELMEILAADKRDDFCRCLAKKMLTYALGRGLQSYDRCAVDAIVKQLADHEYRFSELAIGIVTSDPFTSREVKIER